jgi:hypothetical protein
MKEAVQQVINAHNVDETTQIRQEHREESVIDWPQETSSCSPLLTRRVGKFQTIASRSRLGRAVRASVFGERKHIPASHLANGRVSS